MAQFLAERSLELSHEKTRIRHLNDGFDFLGQNVRRYNCGKVDPGRVTPARLLAWVRGHWSAENSLHFIKDRWGDEDRHYLSWPGLAERWAVLTNAALAVLRVTGEDPKQPLRASADQLNHHVEKAIRSSPNK